MTIDVATYLGDWPLRPITGTRSRLRAMLSEAELETALVSPFAGFFYTDPAPANDALLRQIEGQPDLYAAPIINAQLADAARQVARMAAHPRARAVRVAPGFHGYPVAQAELVVAAAAAHRLATIVQLRMQDERSHSVTSRVPPAPLAEVIALAAAQPRARLVAAAARLSEIAAQAEALRAHANLWLDISHLDGLACVRRACEAVGAGKLLFASSWPFFYAPSARLKVAEADLPARDLARLLGGNAAKVLRLATA